MRQMTKAEATERANRAERQAWRAELALHDVLCNAVSWSGWFKETDSPGKYRAGVSRYESGMPLLLVTFRHPGQTDSTNVYEYEQYVSELRRLRSRSECYEPVLRAVIEAHEAAQLEAENRAMSPDSAVRADAAA